MLKKRVMAVLKGTRWDWQGFIPKDTILATESSTTVELREGKLCLRYNTAVIRVSVKSPYRPKFVPCRRSLPFLFDLSDGLNAERSLIQSSSPVGS